MKLRILENAIRLRLDRSEVDDIAAGQALVASTHFPDGQVFGYQLAASADATKTGGKADDVCCDDMEVQKPWRGKNSLGCRDLPVSLLPA